ncbi:peptidylprolyl isomerase [Ectothiorhodospiraceae bacterium 2226]|nr:peptidylprolyl isomerase [Ectothiorhodospiraceae bacterium 2226]
MKAANGRVVSMEYTLTDGSGQVLDASNGEPMAYLHGFGNIVPGLEKALDGAEVGHKARVHVSADEAYGPKNPEAEFEVTPDKFPEDMTPQVGMQVAAEGPNGPIVLTVKEVKDGGVVLDANHPLAGMDLTFDVEIIDVRDATEEELAHGHAH